MAIVGNMTVQATLGQTVAKGWLKKFLGVKTSTPTVQLPSRERNFCFVRFEVRDDEKLKRLITMIEAFKLDKANQEQKPIESWSDLFNKSELESFWFPDDQEMEHWNSYWFGTPLPKRHSSDMPMPPWHFESMLESILQNGEYDLIGVRSTCEREAVLEFDPHAYPYGGTDALRALVRAFGHRVIGVDDGTGYELGDPVSPLWTPDMTVQP